MSTLATALQPFVDKNYIAGAVLLVATKDRILALDAIGFADLAAKRPMAPDSIFWIASQTKPMTATALMMLVDEGKLTIDDPVEKFLPEYTGQKVIAYRDPEMMLLKKPRHPITVREILSHTSGLGFSSPIETPTLDLLPLATAVRSHAMLPLQSEPGSKYNYANGGTNTAGRLIEVISGMPYEDFMDQRLFHPLGMTDTTFWPSDAQMARLAKVYRATEDKSGLEETTFTQLAQPFSNRSRKPIPAGGLFSTAGDSAKFCQMILNGGVAGGKRLVSEESVRAMTTKQTGDEVEMQYGLCFSAENNRYGHGGAAKTGMFIDPKTGLITVFLIQHNDDWPSDDAGTIGPVFEAAAQKLL